MGAAHMGAAHMGAAHVHITQSKYDMKNSTEMPDQDYNLKDMKTDLKIAIDIIEHINHVCNQDERLPVITNGELVLSMLKLHMESLDELALNE